MLKAQTPLKTFIVLLVVLQIGCTVTRELKPVSKGRSARVISGLLQARAKVQAIHVRMRAARYSGHTARKGRLEVFSRGADLRLEIWSPTDNLLDLTLICKEHFVHEIPGKRLCIEGNVHVLKFIPVVLPYPGIQALFAGLGPNPRAAAVFDAGDGLVLKSDAGPVKYTMNVATNPLRVVSYSVDAGTRRFHVRQTDFRLIDGVLVPMRFRITGSNQVILFRYKSVAINPDLSDDVFDCSCPGNFRVKRLR